MTCTICERRRPRRHCPAVRNEICPPCCGESRETTVDCPLECRFLKEAHDHERVAEPDPSNVPNKDVEITERFVADTAPLFALVGSALAAMAHTVPGIMDGDVREALDAMVRTLRTLESGLVYQTRPANPIAADIQQRLGEEVEAIRKRLQQETGMATLRDADVLGVLVMFQRIEFGRTNGRPRSRAFLDFLCREFPGPLPAGPAAGSLIVPA